MVKMSQKGMGMVEVMVAAAMAAMVSLGVATMMQNSMKESRRVQLLDTLKNKKILFDNMMRDPDIWNRTLNCNAGVPFTQLKTTNNSTSAISLATPVEFQLYTGNTSACELAYDLLGPADTTGPGFSEKGTVCSGFNSTAGSGNDNCPMSYRLLVGVECMNAAAACTNPSLKLVARLVFNPASSGVMGNFTNFISPVAGSSIADTVVDNKYDSVIKRTGTSINRSFRMISGFTPNPGGCDAPNEGGGGLCSTVAGGAIHPRTQGANTGVGMWDDATTARGAYDNYNLVTINPAGTGTFKFNETGYYGCTISVPAFATQSFTAYLRNVSASSVVAEQSITAPQYSSGVATIDAKFNVTDTQHGYAIYQNCQEDGVSDSYQYCTLGIPSTSYGTFQTLITTTCYKLDKTM